MPQNSAQSADPSELARLAALRRYRILDTPEEPEFDRIARLAARLLRAPVGLVSLVDEQRQWFKSHFGLEVRETPREVSFCAHALNSDEVLVVSDATRDPRFADNPLVTGEPRIRSYAGAPLMTKDGFRLGTLSVIDRVPRSDLGSDDFTTLRHLAALVIDEFELRLTTKLTEGYAAKIGRLPEAAALIAGSTSIEQSLNVVTDHVRSVLGASPFQSWPVCRRDRFAKCGHGAGNLDQARERSQQSSGRRSFTPSPLRCRRVRSGLGPHGSRYPCTEGRRLRRGGRQRQGGSFARC